MKLYFAYGSNLWLDQMRKRCPDQSVFSHGVLKGYRWIITTRGVANIVKSVPDEVHGIIYEISESDEETLDRCEGVSNGDYYKKTVLVEAAGQQVNCLVYIDPTEEEGRPRQEYIKRINAGLIDAKLPEEYVIGCIRKFIPVVGLES
jgi:gamma-glutamylcyclotransferase